MMCLCGQPVFIKKTAECQRCYNRRYQREHYVPRSRPLTQPRVVTAHDMSTYEAMIFDALREHKRVLDNARAALWRAENRDQVLASKATYRAEHHDAVLDRNREYNARPEVQERKKSYAQANRERERTREAAWRAANRDRIRERKKARYVPAIRGTRLCALTSCKAAHFSSGLCKNHYQQQYRQTRRAA